MATIYEVSKLAGVSLATVSRVMNNNANVSDATRKKVTAAMDELGYRPNSIAQSLASNCSNSVGLLVSELQGPFYGPMMSGIENTFRNQGKHLIIAAGHSDEEREKQGIEFLIFLLIAVTASKSPGDEIGNPASIISIPISSKTLEI